jgi:hypothetical protein
MWPLFVFSVVLGILALRGALWAYIAFVVLGLLYFPIKVGFQLNPHACQLAFNLRLARFSLTNYPHILLFALFFVITTAQLCINTVSTFALAGLATIAMGAFVEIAEGITGSGNCRLRDLTPDAAGALLGAVILLIWHAAGVQRRFARFSN